MAILTIRSKLGFLVPSRVNFRSNLVKVDENYQVAWVWCRNMKNVILGWFWPTLTFGQPKVYQGYFGQFNQKWHSECSNARTGYATSILIPSWPCGEKIIFLEFLGSDMKIEGGQNTVSIGWKLKGDPCKS